MRRFKIFYTHDPQKFAQKLLYWSGRFQKVCILNSNDYRKRLPFSHSYHCHDLIAGIGGIEKSTITGKEMLNSLDDCISGSGEWWFGHLGYDLKNEIENLSSTHPDKIKFPSLHFFKPRYIFIIKENQIKIGWLDKYDDHKHINKIKKEIECLLLPGSVQVNPGQIKGVISKAYYKKSVEQIKDHIQRGDIYEVNFCQEFYSGNATIDPAGVWLKLLKESPTPFSCYYKLEDKYLLCASPERFMRKTGKTIISQPIKGTAARGKTEEQDRKRMMSLSMDPKERAENIMITDLVRNDLSKIAARSSVKVNELCGIYPFPGVFQMQSDITAELESSVPLSRIIRAMFPMGSMTGAPKVRAMQIIEQYERSNRGLYSGSVGYITPEMDFDFNVVIRSIQYNHENSVLSFMAGGAITSLSLPENEYQECLLKAGSIMKILGYEAVWNH